MSRTFSLKVKALDVDHHEHSNHHHCIGSSQLSLNRLMMLGFSSLFLATPAVAQTEIQLKNMGGMYSGMESTTMVSSNNSFCVGNGQTMLNGFQNARDGNFCMLFLFPDGVVNTPGKYVGAIIGAFLIGMLGEIIVFARNRIDFYIHQQSKWTRVVVFASIYAVQMVVAYFAMLLAMVFEATMFSFIIVGFFVGHFVYLWLTQKFGGRARSSVNPPVITSDASFPTYLSPTATLWSQRVAWTIPRISWAILLILIIYWDIKVEGAFGENALNLFSWHSLCMTIAGPVLMTEAILTFSAPIIKPSFLVRVGVATRRQTVSKYVHIGLHVLTFLLAIMGMVAIAYFKHESGLTTQFPFFTLYSPHSWLGMATMVLWVIQFAGRLIGGVWQPSSEEGRQVWKRLHTFFGHVLYVSVLTCCGLGLQDMQSSDLAGVGYAQDSEFSYLSCAAVIMLMALGVSVHLLPELVSFIQSDKNAIKEQVMKQKQQLE